MFAPRRYTVIRVYVTCVCVCMYRVIKPHVGVCILTTIIVVLICGRKRHLARRMTVMDRCDWNNETAHDREAARYVENNTRPQRDTRRFEYPHDRIYQCFPNKQCSSGKTVFRFMIFFPGERRLKPVTFPVDHRTFSTALHPARRNFPIKILVFLCDTCM